MTGNSASARLAIRTRSLYIPPREPVVDEALANPVRSGRKQP
jgi:hypothetical protein